MTEPDELFNLKNHFWIGNYQMAIKEGSTLRLRAESVKIERDVFVYRSYIAVGNYAVVLDEIKDTKSTPVDLAAVKLLATYLSNPSAKETAVVAAHQLLADSASANNATAQLIAGTIFLYEENYADALRAVKSTTDLQQMALTVQILLKMNRIDLAQKHQKRMETLDDESTLTALARAWINLALGGDKYVEARYVFQELIDKFGASVTLLNSLATSHIALGQYDDAERYLIDAIGKSANDPDVLWNLISCAQHTGKPPEFVQRYTNQLKRAAPTHPATKQLTLLESMFERVATQYAI